MYEIYSLVDHAQLAFIVLGLLISWKVPTARWFFISYLVVISINMTMFPITFEWKTHYYIFQAFLNIVFILPIVYRRDLALFLYNKTGANFYKQVYEKQKLSSQECMILIIFCGAVLVNSYTWLEVLAYKYYWIDNAYFKLYFRNNIITIIQLMLCACFLSYALKAESRELNYENTK
ncbi:hypothetical protein [Pseudoalteromonas luteoviolacea]|uniref:Uncharacterized protein n=1 Tax=Pseudoalteromonas luteoviolacea S4054 TaxID=1129367 RepID=A0A0F6A572_9GAMM|nr:hypothetical protein [Pseudoalteromonas luteoviolacea]AOT07575.1 hypothetical protein S4054249_06850 [Pseudoalteromonas luteoviolacea]AOT12491.1 hypothetical protein S40542_06850 [Pseudoalteromonas luteoviolacea]AOT17405.1 hypothetical protein S4054_06850 [Pseudoalteromonas luteoviolacea]KKE81312.1 hypothetical protein N479_22515 [Pseudoalteromonas luteoviolacea S4054]KZN70679.1 hypothetical protein N481_20920 [Pseudoalteromonas luteoviolacea S4047-1]